MAPGEQGAQNRFEVQRRCPTCRGEGIVERPASRAPAEYLWSDEGFWRAEEALLGEGQMVVPDLVEIVSCPDCAGHGRVSVRLSPEQYRALRRRRLWRGVFLFFIGLVPFALLMGAILANPEMLCGRPWYGVGVLILLLAASRPGRI